MSINGKMIVRNSLIGGVAGSLDNIDGDLLIGPTVALVGIPPNVAFWYIDLTSGEVPDDITIIAPVVNAGDKRWKKYNVI